MATERSRDPLGNLPLLPRFPRSSDGPNAIAANDHSLRRQVNRALIAIRGLWRGRWDLEQLREVPTGSLRDWKGATATQRFIVRQIADELAKKPYSEEHAVGQAAYEKFTRAPAGGGYAGSSMGKKLEARGELPKGSLCSARLDEISIPPQGVQPVDPTVVSPRLRAYYERASSTMLLGEIEVDREAMEETPQFMDALFKDLEKVWELSVVMASSGRSGYTETCACVMSWFTVVKQYTNGKLSSRIVWDCRMDNHLFHAQPWVPMGSPSTVSHM